MPFPPSAPSPATNAHFSKVSQLAQLFAANAIDGVPEVPVADAAVNPSCSNVVAREKLVALTDEVPTSTVERAPSRWTHSGPS
jgi:hypothetical protein